VIRAARGTAGKDLQVMGITIKAYPRRRRLGASNCSKRKRSSGWKNRLDRMILPVMPRIAALPFS
jgi:hypothetical protein